MKPSSLGTAQEGLPLTEADRRRWAELIAGLLLECEKIGLIRINREWPKAGASKAVRTDE
jgi:hypothetical protein